MINKKQKKAIKQLMKDFLKNESDDIRNGFNELYRYYKSNGYSDENFYKEIFTHMGYVKGEEK